MRGWMGMLWLSAVAAAGALGCNDDDDGADIYMMSERYELTDQGEELAGGGCLFAISADGEGGGSSTTGGKWGPGGLDPDFIYGETTDLKRVTVTIRSNDEIIEERQYDEAFLESGKVDRFLVLTERGRVFRFAYWGGPECDTSHLPLDG